jgi:hypothetical protein
LGTPAEHYQRQFNLVDSFSVVNGAHQLRFGADYRTLSPVSGAYEYSILAFFRAPIDNAVTGRSYFVDITSGSGRLYPRFTNFSAYAQDSWRATRRLTLNYGVRWELNPPPTEAHGRDALTVRGRDDPATMTLAPQGTPPWKPTYGNFAPRLGVAYQLTEGTDRETVLRGGFGIFYDLGTGSAGSALSIASYPFFTFKELLNMQFPLSPDQSAPLPFSTSPPYPTLYIADPNLELPRTYEWNLAVERSLGADETVSATYVGAAGRRLLRQEVLSTPTFSDLHVTRNTATSDYHALQLQFERRLSRGLQALVSYTWSHSIDTLSSETQQSVPGTTIDPNVDRGSSDFDVRHSLAAAVTYNLPSPDGSQFTRALFGGWSVDAVLRARSATPVNPKLPLVPLFDAYGPRRPDIVPGFLFQYDDPSAPGGRVINRAAFTNPPDGRQGDLGRNALRGFPVSQVDLALRRQFGITEQVRLQFRAEFFNIFNHPNFGAPITALGSPDFGRAATMFNSSEGFAVTGLSPLYQIGGPRSIQLALKILF